MASNKSRKLVKKKVPAKKWNTMVLSTAEGDLNILFIVIKLVTIE